MNFGIKASKVESMGNLAYGSASGIKAEYLDSPEFVEKAIRLAIANSNMHLRQLVFEKFEPQGITMVAVLSESHLSIHTYPEKGYMFLDCFTCGQEGDPMRAVDTLIMHFGATMWHTSIIERTVPVE